MTTTILFILLALNGLLVWYTVYHLGVQRLIISHQEVILDLQSQIMSSLVKQLKVDKKK